jgi:hypothetical protein
LKLFVLIELRHDAVFFPVIAQLAEPAGGIALAVELEQQLAALRSPRRRGWSARFVPVVLGHTPDCTKTCDRRGDGLVLFVHALPRSVRSSNPPR